MHLQLNVYFNVTKREYGYKLNRPLIRMVMFQKHSLVHICSYDEAPRLGTLICNIYAPVYGVICGIKSTARPPTTPRHISISLQIFAHTFVYARACKCNERASGFAGQLDPIARANKQTTTEKHGTVSRYVCQSPRSRAGIRWFLCL